MSIQYPSFDSDDMRLKKIGSFFSSLKNEAKPLISSFTTEAKARGQSLVSDTQNKIGTIRSSDGYNEGGEFTTVKDNSRARHPDTSYDSDGNSIAALPEGSEITIYPSYTLLLDSKYHVEVRGWLSAPGSMNRKNRLIFSLAKSLIKPGSSASADALAAGIAMSTTGHGINLNGSGPDAFDDASSYSSADTSSIIADNSSVNEVSYQQAENVLRDRMAYFFAKSLAGIPLDVIVCSENEQDSDRLVMQSVTTDLNGKFELTIKTPYKPSLVQVSVNIDSINPVFCHQEILYIQPQGFSIISDIDDTIKKTEVTSDKRTVFNNVFVKDLRSSAVEGVAQFYYDLYSKHSCLFHYVSNSPWQLYPTISKFFRLARFPPGSIHLKQYTGNILSSLMEPAAERKRHVLHKILDEFQHRRFLLIGDSGEQDFDAYLDVCRQYSSQILRIYIRVVPGSLSDFNDMRVLREINRLLSIRRERIKLKSEYLNFSNTLPTRHTHPHPKAKLQIESDSSPETSEDEMEKPDYDWNILSHTPATYSAPGMVGYANSDAKWAAGNTTRSSVGLSSLSTGLSSIQPRKKPPLPPRRGTKPKEPIEEETTAVNTTTQDIFSMPEKKPQKPDKPSKPAKKPPPKPVKKPLATISASQSSSRPPPPPPRSRSVLSQVDPFFVDPKLVHSATTANAAEIRFDPAVVSHSASEIGIATSGSSQAIHASDRKGELWLSKVSLAVNGLLPDHIDIIFWLEVQELEEDCEQVFKNYVF